MLMGMWNVTVGCVWESQVKGRAGNALQPLRCGQEEGGEESYYPGLCGRPSAECSLPASLLSCTSAIPQTQKAALARPPSPKHLPRPPARPPAHRPPAGAARPGLCQHCRLAFQLLHHHWLLQPFGCGRVAGRRSRSAALPGPPPAPPAWLLSVAGCGRSLRLKCPAALLRASVPPKGRAA